MRVARVLEEELYESLSAHVQPGLHRWRHATSFERDLSSDQDSCGTGSTSEANDIFDTLDDHLGYGSDSGSGW